MSLYKTLLCNFVKSTITPSRAFCVTQLQNNSLRCTYGSTARSTYPRLYKTVLVLLDGSTLTVRCREPKALLQLPVDMNSLDEKERLKLWVSRKKKEEVLESDFLDTTFDAESYTQYYKK